jgi:hypothetical protein
MNARKGARFQRARDELLRAVSELQAGQSYYVFLFCWNVEEMLRGRDRDYLDVKPGHVQKLRRWLNDVSLGPGTDPRQALSLAHRMNPDAVFLLSDGQFNQPRTPWSESGWLGENENRVDLGVQEGVEKFYRRIPIHTISFENPFTVDAMKDIARSSGGSSQYIRTNSLQPIDSQRFVDLVAEIDRKYGQQADRTREYQARLSAARELICDGELLYAEYIVRPLAEAPPAEILNPTLLDDVMDILRSELAETRLEDFQSLPSDFAPSFHAETPRT